MAEREAGFTLLELLVALALFSLAALALVKLQGVSVRTTADLDSRMLAETVARNISVELTSDPHAPPLGQADGMVENGGRRWHWSRTTIAGPDARLVRVDIRVTGEAGTSPALLSILRPAG